MWTHPGKKLLFMGNEFAQGKEWNFDSELDWHLLDVSWHSGAQQLVKDLNATYRTTPALYEKDCEPAGFCWLDHENSEQSIFSFIRFASDEHPPAIVVCNFTPQVHYNYAIGVPKLGRYKEVLNTDAQIYGGSNQGNQGGVNAVGMPWQNQPYSMTITVPPLSTVVFVLEE
jgi:1,4-alpha-glucan branching enzyme